MIFNRFIQIDMRPSVLVRKKHIKKIEYRDKWRLKKRELPANTKTRHTKKLLKQQFYQEQIKHLFSSKNQGFKKNLKFCLSRAGFNRKDYKYIKLIYNLLRSTDTLSLTTELSKLSEKDHKYIYGKLNNTEGPFNNLLNTEMVKNLFFKALKYDRDQFLNAQPTTFYSILKEKFYAAIKENINMLLEGRNVIENKNILGYLLRNNNINKKVANLIYEKLKCTTGPFNHINRTILIKNLLEPEKIENLFFKALKYDRDQFLNAQPTTFYSILKEKFYAHISTFPTISKDLKRKLCRHKIYYKDSFISFLNTKTMPEKFKPSTIKRSNQYPCRTSIKIGDSVLKNGEKIGAGSRGEVWRYQDKATNRYVVVKYQKILGRSNLKSLCAEANIGFNLGDHYNIVKTTNMEVLNNDYAAIVMPYVKAKEGTTCVDFFQKNPKKAINFARSLCKTMTMLHNKDFVHRDIKPDNLLIDPDGEVQLIDFGISHSSLNGACGTRHYMPIFAAPMNMRNAKIFDQYALALTISEMLTPDGIDIKDGFRFIYCKNRKQKVNLATKIFQVGKSHKDERIGKIIKDCALVMYKALNGEYSDLNIING